MCRGRTDEWDCVSICTFLFTPPPSLFLQIKPSQDPGFHAPLSGSTQRPDQRPRAGGGTRHIISLAGRLLGAGLMDCGPSARTGSAGYSLPPWSLRSSSSAWSLRSHGSRSSFWLRSSLYLAPFQATRLLRSGAAASVLSGVVCGRASRRICL